MYIYKPRTLAPIYIQLLFSRNQYGLHNNEHCHSVGKYSQIHSIKKLILVSSCLGVLTVLIVLAVCTLFLPEQQAFLLHCLMIQLRLRWKKLIIWPVDFAAGHPEMLAWQINQLVSVISKINGTRMALKTTCYAQLSVKGGTPVFGLLIDILCPYVHVNQQSVTRLETQAAFWLTLYNEHYTAHSIMSF